MNNQNQQLSKLPVKDLAKKIICDGHLYLTVGTRKYYLMKPGIFVDQGFIKKHAVKDPIFDFECVVNKSVRENFQKHFKELRYLQFEKDLRGKCTEILKYFQDCYTTGEHFLSFALACHEEFCQISLDDQSKMHETDMHLFRKALYASAFSVITGMTNDYFHFLMLKDFYNLTFALDVGLCEPNYSYYVAEACNTENRMPGSGKTFLATNGASDFEKEVFLKHPERSYDYFKKKAFLSYPELAEIVLYQHELKSGEGFPRGIKQGRISSWEAIVIFADSLVELSAEYSFETDVVNYLLTFQNEKLNDLPVERVYKKIVQTFEHFQSVKEGNGR